jgi:hypothetical protein
LTRDVEVYSLEVTDMQVIISCKEELSCIVERGTRRAERREKVKGKRTRTRRERRTRV